MNQPPAFQFYVDNFIQGTCDMEPSEVGIYIRLLCYQWSNGYIPSEKGRLSRVAGGEVSAHVLAKFVKGPDGMLRNARIERERAKQFHFRQKQAEYGKTGGRPRKGSLSTEKGLEKGSQSPRARVPSPSPSPSPLSDPNSNGEGKASRSHPFKAPSIEAIKLQAAKIGCSDLEASKFHAHFESNGWRVGSNPMRSWSAALQKWHLNGDKYGSLTTTKSPPQTHQFLRDLQKEIERDK